MSLLNPPENIKDFHQVYHQTVENLIRMNAIEAALHSSSDLDAETALFHETCRDNLEYLINATNTLIEWINAASYVATQIAQRKTVCNREEAIQELATFLARKTRQLNHVRTGQHPWL